MKCSQCRNYIESDLLAEVATIECHDCGATVEVNNVLVRSSGLTYARDDLIKRYFRYSRLLDDAIRERTQLEENPHRSEQELAAIEQLIAALSGLMKGARGHFRYDFEGATGARLNYREQTCQGALINLSMTGACVEVPASLPPHVNDDMTLQTRLPGQDKPLLLGSKVRWTKPVQSSTGQRCQFGVSFNLLPADAKSMLWSFLSNNTAQK